ncbi:hypothetical protein ACWD4G_32125 [Streptomyces sp. NPDC002643]
MTGWRRVVAGAVGGLLLTGCTGGSGGGDEDQGDAGDRKGSAASASADASPEASAAPSSSPSPVDEPYTLAEDRAPRTRAEAVAFVRELEVRPDFFGPGYRKRDPFESDPDQWAVLGEDCLWRREALPGSVLASLTRSIELPARGSTGPVSVSLTVTVHEDVAAARRDMAGALESALRCPEQRLNSTDVVQGLYSRIDAFTDARNAVAEDDLTETGEWVSEAAGGAAKALPFDWFKFRIGPVTVGATARHGAGRTEEEDATISSNVTKGVSFVASEIDTWGEAGGSGGSSDAGGSGGTGEADGGDEAGADEGAGQ